jgi:ADP-ribose pyrophosphatase YjhB (NUDIX family)
MYRQSGYDSAAIISGVRIKGKMHRTIRCQAAILKGTDMLLIRHTLLATGEGYWVIPGGGQEAGESEKDCIVREAYEETNLVVEVDRLLMEESDVQGSPYKRRKTFACKILSGNPSPGYEPEPEASSRYAITAVRWVDLQDEDSWGVEITGDPITFPQLQKIRELTAC